MSRLPSSPEAEQAVLGALLYDNTHLTDLGALTPRDFHDGLHAAMFVAISTRIVNGELADPITIAPDFEQSQAFAEMGGMAYLGDLYAKAPHSAISYAETLRQQTRRRELIAIGDDLANGAHLGNREQIDDAQSRLATLRDALSPFRLHPTLVPPPELIPVRQWLYGHHLIRKYASTTIAPGGLGKSSLVLAEAVAMAVGRPILGDRPHGPLRVFYWNGEDPQDETDRRLAAILAAHRLKNEDIGGRLYTASGRDMPLQFATMGPDGVLINETMIAQLIAQIRHHQIDVVIIDPLISTHALPENDNGAIDALVKRGFSRIANDTNCAMDIVHHIRKPGGGNTADTSVDDARGASALIGAVRSARVLNAMSEQEAERWEVKNRFEHFRVDNGKSNLAPRSDKAVWRQIVSVDMQNGSPPDYVGAVVEWSPPEGDILPLNAQQLVKTEMGARNWRKDSRSPDWIGKAIGRAFAWDYDDKETKHKIASLIKDWIKNGVLRYETQIGPDRHPTDYVVFGDS